LENRAGDPAMTLVVDGVRFFKKWEAAVLWLKCGLQVRAVVDGMRPGVAGEPLEPFGKALLNVYGQRVVPGTGVGELRIDAVERHWNAEADRITGEMRQRNPGSVPPCCGCGEC